MTGAQDMETMDSAAPTLSLMVSNLVSTIPSIFLCVCPEAVKFNGLIGWYRETLGAEEPRRRKIRVSEVGE